MKPIKRDSFICYKSFVDAGIQLDDQNRLKFFDRLLKYAILWVDEKTSGFAETLFILVKPNLDSNNKKYTDWCKWWRPKLTTGCWNWKPNEEEEVEEEVEETENIYKTKIDNKRVKKEIKNKSILKNINLIKENGNFPAEYESIVEDFVDYWSEKDNKGNEKRTKNKTRETLLRLKTWKRNSTTNFWRNTKYKPDYEILEQFHKQINLDITPIKERFCKKYWEWRQQRYSDTKLLRKKSPLYLM